MPVVLESVHDIVYFKPVMPVLVIVFQFILYIIGTVPVLVNFMVLTAVEVPGIAFFKFIASPSL